MKNTATRGKVLKLQMLQ